MKRRKRGKNGGGGKNTFRGQLAQPSHFCGFVDVAEVAKEKDMRMVEREERRRPRVKMTAVWFCFCS